LTSAHVASDVAIYSGPCVRGSECETSGNLTSRVISLGHKTRPMILLLQPCFKTFPHFQQMMALHSDPILYKPIGPIASLIHNSHI